MICLIPMRFTIDNIIDFRNLKMYFHIDLFSYMRVIGGYITLEQDGFAIHTTKNNAYFKPLFQKRKKNKKRKFNIKLRKIYYIIEIGDNNFLEATLYALGVNYLLGELLKIICGVKDIKIEKRQILYREADRLNMVARFILEIRLFDLIRLLVDNIKEGLIENVTSKTGTQVD